MPPRSYEQYCPIAVALDVLGDRWTLLVIRELLLGPKRYTDLQQSLPGISPNLLSERLRTLEEAGLVTRAELPPPAARTVYELTDEGRAARETLGALARFGARHLPVVSRGAPVRPAMAVYGMLVPFLDRQATEAVDDHYRLVLDGEQFDLAVTSEGVVEPAPGSAPDLVIESRPWLLVAARQGRVDFLETATDGRLHVDGSRAALRRFLSVFSFPRASR